MNRLTLLLVNPYQVLKCPLSIVIYHVVVLGLKQAPCINLTHSSIGLYGIIKLACALLGIGILIFHNHVSISLDPLRISLLFFVILTSSFSNTELKPSSHNCAMDNKFPVCRSMNRFASLALLEIVSIDRFVVVVDVIVPPFGTRTFIGGADFMS